MKTKNLILFILSMAFITFDSFSQSSIEKLYKTGGSSIGIRDMDECSNGDFITGIDYNNTQAGLMRLSNNGNVLWAKKLVIDSALGSCSFQVVQGTNNNYYLNGLYLNNNGSGSDVSMFVSNFDNQGNINWTKSYPMGSGNYRTNKMKILSNDTLLSLASVANKIVIIKTDPNGNLVFGKTITTDTLGGSKNPGFDVIQLANGNLLATSKIGSNFMAILMDYSGQTLWTKTYRIGSYVQAHSVVENALNQVFISGNLNASGPQTFIMELDMAQGNINNLKIFNTNTSSVSPKFLNIYNNNLYLTYLSSGSSSAYDKSFISVIDFNSNIVNSYESDSNYNASNYHKILFSSNNTSLIYGSNYNSGLENGMIIETTSIDSSCLYNSVNLSLQQFTDYNIDTNNQYFIIPYTSDSSLTITTQNISVTTSDLCSSIVSIDEISKENSFEIYPNPTYKQITISGLNQAYDIQIYNTIGQLLFSENNITVITKSIDVNAFDNGILLVHITSNGESYIRKIIKQ